MLINEHTTAEILRKEAATLRGTTIAAFLTDRERQLYGRLAEAYELLANLREFRDKAGCCPTTGASAPLVNPLPN